MLATLILALVLPLDSPNEVLVRNSAELQSKLSVAKPGDLVLVAPGEYRGGIHVSVVSGTRLKPIVVAAQIATNPPRFVGGGNAIQLSSCSWITLRDLAASNQTGNGFNIDDGGTKKHVEGIVLDRLQVSQLPRGNHDGIKLSGLRDFVVTDCRIEKWGGSAIDMVGCVNGVIRDCDFRNGGDNGVQTKGGSKDIKVRSCKFEEYGQRGVNLGGSTGMAFFRPPIEQVPAGKRFEAQNISVQGCTFIGGVAPIAFVGIDRAMVEFNTIINPGRWAIRILQETQDKGFLPCRNGEFRNNLIVFRSDNWASGGVNIGPGTEAESFLFDRNFWFCSDQPARSRPNLPVSETGGSYGVDPKLAPNHAPASGSPASNVGAHAFRKKD
jgi:hypothetical protein